MRPLCQLCQLVRDPTDKTLQQTHSTFSGGGVVLTGSPAYGAERPFFPIHITMDRISREGRILSYNATTT